MALLLQSAEVAPQPGTGNIYNDIIAATDHAYDAIAARGMDRDTVCKLPVCSEASSLIVKSLIDCGHIARQEVVVSAEVGSHSYPVIINNGEELIADSAWQQFLPKDVTNNDHMPKVLVGSRRDIMNMARSFGVGESVLHIWEANTSGMSFDKARLNDRAAEDDAEQATDSGAWEKFMAA